MNFIVAYTLEGNTNPSFKLATTGFSGAGIFLRSSSWDY